MGAAAGASQTSAPAGRVQYAPTNPAAVGFASVPKIPTGFVRQKAWTAVPEFATRPCAGVPVKIAW